MAPRARCEAVCRCLITRLLTGVPTIGDVRDLAHHVKPAAKVEIAVMSYSFRFNAVVYMCTHTIHAVPHSCQQAQGKAGQHEPPCSRDTLKVEASHTANIKLTTH